MKIKIVLFILLITITGCHNYNELEDLSICTAMAIDLEDDKYKVTYMIANSKKSDVSAKEGEAQTVLYSGIGRDISEAIDEIALVSPKVIYIGHLSVIVISDKVANKGVNNILDYLLRNQQSRKKFDIVLTQDSKAEDVLKILSPLETFPSKNILSNLNSSKQFQSFSSTIDFNAFVNDILKEGYHPTISSISVIGNAKEGSKLESLEKTVTDTYLKVNTIGIFKDYKLIGFANDKETLGINFLHNNIAKALVSIPCEDNYIEFNIDKSKTKINVEYKEKIIVDINITSEAIINEVNCTINLEENNTLKKLEKKGKEELTDIINQSIDLAKAKKVDIFGIGSMIYKKYPKKWKDMKKDWDEKIFPNINFNLKIEFKIIGTGSLRQSIGVQYEES